MNLIRVPLFLVVACSLMLLGCVDSHTVATSNNSVDASSVAASEAAPAPVDPAQASLLNTATSASVDAESAKWTASADDTGIIVHPGLMDDNGQPVLFDGVVLPVDITIYTTETDAQFNEVKGREIYSGNGTIDSWKDGNMFYSGGIRVPYAAMATNETDAADGILYIVIHTPNGNYSAKTTFVPIKAP